MGADGYLEIYDADAIDAAGLQDQFNAYFTSTTEQFIFGHRIYTVYWDTEHVDRDWGFPDRKDVFQDYQIGEEWNIWT